ncbi:MAG: glycosyltransferase family 39 protein [Anaerolineae bacterium]
MPARRPLAALFALMLPLALAWWLLVPPWEAPDGVWHWHFAAHLADGGGLPRSVAEARDAPWRQEGSQPPLYYALVALAVRPFDRSDGATALRDNPHAAVGVASEGGNVNRMVHPPRERFPWRGVARAARVAGLVSLLLAMIAVAFTHAAARRLLPDRPDVALAAAATVGLSPAVLFFGTQISNDIAALAAGAAVLWAIARVVEGGATVRGAATLGVACGVAVLCKLNGVFLWPVAGIAILVAATPNVVPPNEPSNSSGQRTSPSPSIAGGGWGVRASLASAMLPVLSFTVALALVAAWWPVRNWRLFGDPTGLPLMWAAMPRRPSSPSLGELAGQMAGVWKSMWAVFGWYNLPAPGGVFLGLAAANAVGLAGALWAVASERRATSAARGRRRVAETVALCAAIVASLLVGIVLWARVQFPQGRLLFPAVPALALLLAIGWGEVGVRTIGERRWPWLVAAPGRRCRRGCWRRSWRRRMGRRRSRGRAVGGAKGTWTAGAGRGVASFEGG